MKVLSIVNDISKKSLKEQYINNLIWSALNLEYHSLKKMEDLIIKNPIEFDDLASFIKDNKFYVVLISNQRYLTMNNIILDKFKKDIAPAFLIETDKMESLGKRMFSDNPYNIVNNPEEFYYINDDTEEELEHFIFEYEEDEE